MKSEKEIQAKISELNDQINKLDDQRLHDKDEFRRLRYLQDIKECKGCILALKWVLEEE